MLGITALFGFCGHYLAKHFDIKSALILAVVVFLGAQFSSRITIKTDKILLKRIYALFIFLISAWMIISVIK